MKKRLHDKKAGIAILISLIIISLAEIIFRAIAMGEAVLTTANLGEQIAVIALAVTILILTAKGKDRACYICYGAWIGYFVFDHIFELPGQFISALSSLSKSAMLSNGGVIDSIGVIVHVLTYVGIIVIGILLVEYMNDGSIYNRAFNISCAITLALLVLSVAISVYNVCMGMPLELMLIAFNNLYRITMVFLFTFFAYDSAKAQLKKANLGK